MGGGGKRIRRPGLGLRFKVNPAQSWFQFLAETSCWHGVPADCDRGGEAGAGAGAAAGGETSSSSHAAASAYHSHRVVLPRLERRQARPTRRPRPAPPRQTRDFALTADGRPAAAAAAEEKPRPPGYDNYMLSSSSSASSTSTSSESSGSSGTDVYVCAEDGEEPRKSKSKSKAKKQKEEEEDPAAPVVVPPEEPVFLLRVQNTFESGVSATFAFGTRSQLAQAAPLNVQFSGGPFPGAGHAAAAAAALAAAAEDGGDEAAALNPAVGAECAVDEATWVARGEDLAERVRQAGDPQTPPGTVVHLDSAADDECCTHAEYVVDGRVQSRYFKPRADVPRHARFRTLAIAPGVAVVWRGFRIAVEDEGEEKEAEAAAAAAEGGAAVAAAAAGTVYGRLYSVTVSRQTLTKSAKKS